MKLFDQNGKLDSDVQDALYELGNVGLGMASVTIGKILGVRVELDVPVVVPVRELMEKPWQPAEKSLFFLRMHMHDPLKGSVVFVMEQEFVVEVIRQMTGRVFVPEALLKDEIAYSALSEFASMLAAAYMKAIGKYTGLRLYMSNDFSVIDRSQVQLDKLMEAQGTLADQAIWIETGFVLVQEDGEKSSNKGKVIMIPDEKTVETLLDGMGLL